MNAPLDSQIEIVTPENIAFHHRVAGPFRRLPAFLIDFTIRILVILFLTIILGLVVAYTGLGVPGVSTIIWFLLDWFYGGFFESMMNGQTPGKWIMGIRVVTVDGQPINGIQAVMRNILRFVDSYPILSLAALRGWPFFSDTFAPEALYVVPTFLVGLVAMTVSPKFQRLGDWVCGTMVVIEERHWLMGIARLEDPRAAQLAAHIPANYEVSRSLASVLAVYVERRRFFSPARKRDVAHYLAQPLLVEFGLPPDTSFDLLLCALYYRTFVADRGDGQVATTMSQPMVGNVATPMQSRPPLQ